MVKSIVRKVSMNKRTKQLSVTIPKRKVKAANPTIKFGEDLFVRISFIPRNKKR